MVLSLAGEVLAVSMRRCTAYGFGPSIASCCILFFLNKLANYIFRVHAFACLNASVVEFLFKVSIAFAEHFDN
jgi:ABC-type Mn2+/Zn2+ transport system permease subunit